MADEPQYVSVGDEFGDDSWRYPDTDFEKEILHLTGRKYFKNQVQAKRVRAIEGKTSGDNPKFPLEYIKQIFEWCREKNRRRTVIVLDTLIKTIRNPDNLSRYYNDQPAVEDRGGYGSDISW